MLDEPEAREEVAAYWSASGVANYEKTWRSRLRLILKVIDEGETDLARALGEVVRRLEAKRGGGLGSAGYVAFDKPVGLPHLGGGYLHRGVVARSVLGACSPQTGSIVELGSGWGEHLCNIWLAGGPMGARYYACELSEYGRKCALVLAALEPAMALEAPRFNYVEPDFAFMPADQDEVVVYSVHSVEQVRDVAPDLIERLCGVARVVRCIHVEPVGWQMVPEAEWNDVTARHAERCREKGYNENLWRLLREAESDGRIRIEAAVPNFFGVERNPASYIRWSTGAS